MRRGLGIGVVSSLAFLTGCSFVFVRSPPDDVTRIPPTEKVQCVSSKVAPVVDSVIGAYQLVRVGYAMSQASSEYLGQPLSRDEEIVIGGALAALFVSSAVYGFVTTGNCAEAKAQHAARLPPPAPAAPAPAAPAPAAPAPAAPAPAAPAPAVPAPTAPPSGVSPADAPDPPPQPSAPAPAPPPYATPAPAS